MPSRELLWSRSIMEAHALQVANRHNYILWLKSLMDSSSYDAVSQKLTGLDIGTGASCIYPLLGCKQRDWSFVATGESAGSAAKCIRLTGSRYRQQELGIRQEECRDQRFVQPHPGSFSFAG